MAELLKDKVALITGAASGIGRATALHFAREGATVLVADYNERGGRETVALVSEAGGQADFFRVDVSDAELMEQTFNQVAARYGGLDVLMNNAGIGNEGGSNPIYTMPENDFDKVIAINLRGVFLGIKYGVPLLMMRGGGRIINMASIAGLGAFPGNCAYAASKAGVISLTKTAALEYAAVNIRVNCICPGWTDTPILDKARQNLDPESLNQLLIGRTAVGRLGQPEEIAAVAFQLATGPDFMTGSAIVIDGGMGGMIPSTIVDCTSDDYVVTRQGAGEWNEAEAM